MLLGIEAFIPNQECFNIWKQKHWDSKTHLKSKTSKQIIFLENINILEYNCFIILHTVLYNFTHYMKGFSLNPITFCSVETTSS